MYICTGYLHCAAKIITPSQLQKLTGAIEWYDGHKEDFCSGLLAKCLCDLKLGNHRAFLSRGMLYAP